MIITITLTDLHDDELEEIKRIIEENNELVRQGRLRFFHSEDWMYKSVGEGKGKKGYAATILTGDSVNSVRMDSVPCPLDFMIVFDKEATPKRGVVSSILFEIAEAIRWDKRSE